MSLTKPCSELGSKPFKFVVEGRLVYMHRDLILALSKPLDHLINSDFAEGRAEEADLPGVDYDTFLRFAQWAYAGRYFPSNPRPRSIEKVETDTTITLKTVTGTHLSPSSKHKISQALRH